MQVGVWQTNTGPNRSWQEDPNIRLWATNSIPHVTCAPTAVPFFGETVPWLEDLAPEQRTQLGQIEQVSVLQVTSQEGQSNVAMAVYLTGGGGPG